MWWTSAEPKLAVSVTSVTDKVNPFFGSSGLYSPGFRLGKHSSLDNFPCNGSIFSNNLRELVTLVQLKVT